MGGISLYFDTYYLWMFVAINIILIFYKSFTYTYSHSSRALDSIVVVFWALSDISRIILAKKGNKCEDSYPLLINLALAIPVIMGHVFFILWQTIILEMDKILSIVGIVFVSMEIILSAIAIVTFTTSKRRI